MFWMPSMWTVGSVQGSLPELDHGLGVAIVTVDGVEKACCCIICGQAIGNEDASGDVKGLRQEIQELKVPKP